jgi:hypothetical protein
MIVIYEIILIAVIWLIVQEIEHYHLVEEGMRQFRKTYNKGIKSETWFLEVTNMCINWKQKGKLFSTYYL